MLFRDETDNVEYVETIDPQGTQLFEDGQRVDTIMRGMYVNGIWRTMKRTTVTYVNVTPLDLSNFRGKGYKGLVAGNVCNVIIYRFSSYYSDSELIHRQMSISNGNAIAIRNSRYYGDDSIDEYPLARDLRNAAYDGQSILSQESGQSILSQESGQSTFHGKDERTIGEVISYWSHLISKNAEYIMKAANRSHLLEGYLIGDSHHKFTAIVRNKDSCRNVSILLETLFTTPLPLFIY